MKLGVLLFSQKSEFYILWYSKLTGCYTGFSVGNPSQIIHFSQADTSYLQVAIDIVSWHFGGNLSTITAHVEPTGNPHTSAFKL